MSNIPTLAELSEAVYNDLKGQLNLSDTERKVARAFANTLAGQLRLLYIRQADAKNNLYPDTADLAENGGELERLGAIHLGRDINPATAGVFEIAVTGEENAVLRSGLTFKSNDDAENPGKLYIIDAEYILTGENDLVDIRSLEGGVENNLEVGNELTITEPVLGVSQTVTINEVVTAAKAAETVEDYRQAILDSMQLEPQGGAKTDYMLWARDAQGVRRVFPYVKNENAGTVEIFVEATEEDSTDGLGTPAEDLLNEVEAVINYDPDETRPMYERGRKPAQAFLDVKPIVLVPVEVDIYQLSERTTTIETAIFENLKSYIRNIRPYIDGGDLARDKNDVLIVARLQGVVSDVVGTSNSFNDFVMKVNGVPQTSSLFDGGTIPYLNAVNYI